MNGAAARGREEDKRKQGFQAEGGTAIIKRTNVNRREGGVGMKREKGNLVQDDKTRSVGETAAKESPNNRTLGP